MNKVESGRVIGSETAFMRFIHNHSRPILETKIHCSGSIITSTSTRTPLQKNVRLQSRVVGTAVEVFRLLRIWCGPKM